MSRQRAPRELRRSWQAAAAMAYSLILCCNAEQAVVSLKALHAHGSSFPQVFEQLVHPLPRQILRQTVLCLTCGEIV